MISFIKKRWFLILISLVVIGGMYFYYTSSQNAKEKDSQTYTLKKEDLEESLSLSGKIEAEQHAVLRFQTSGRLAWIGVKEGDSVSKYQSLASLDQRDIKNRLKKYLNTYASQRLDFEQTKDDYWNKQYDLSESIRKSAERTLEENQYSLENSVLDVELQDLSLEYSTLFTPIEGILTRVDIPEPGINITPAGAEFEVVNPKTIYLSVVADQTEVVDLEEGMEGVIVFDSYPDDTYRGTIDYISYSPKEGETGTIYEIKVIFEGREGFRLGMTGDIDFIIRQKKDVLAVPSTYIKESGRGSYVYVKEKNKMVKRYVKTGQEIDGKTVINEGLTVGEIVYD